MTNITENFASKLAVAFVAVAMMLSAFAPAVQAQTTEELQTMINDLLKQVAELQGKGTGSGSTASSCVSIPAPLTMNSTGANVTALQNRLIADGESIPAGATGFFGAQTRTALASWQGKNGVMPAAGYYGPITMAAMDAKCVPADTDEDEDMDEDEDDSDSDVELGGEASLDNYEMEDGESTIEEGDEDVVIGELTVEFADGDAEISRLDFTIDNGNIDPWDVFETFSVWVDGDMVAEFAADDEDEYLDEDSGEFRFTDLGIVAMEDEELEIAIGATVQSSVDDTDLAGSWTLTGSSIRFFDADGVATTEEVDSTDGTSNFDIDEAGAEEEINVSLSSSNPDSTDVVVDTDSDTNDVTIMVADIEAEDNDIELNTVVVKIETTNSTNTTDVIDEARIVIDGEEFTAEAIGTENDFAAGDQDPATGLSEGRSERATATSSVWYLFDIDGDVVIDADSEVEMEVVVDLNDTDDGVRYANGTTIKASVTSVELGAWAAEGADDVDNFGGSAVGDNHTLVAEGILVPVDGFEATTDRLGDNDTIGEFTLDFEVSAVEGDFYITEFASTSATNQGVEFGVDGTVGTGSVTASLTSTADEDTPGVFTVREGETETFTLTVTIDPQNPGQFRVSLEEIYFSASSNGTSNPQLYVPTPVSDFRSANISIN